MGTAPRPVRSLALTLALVGGAAVARPTDGLSRAEAALDRGQFRVAEQAYRDVLLERPLLNRAVVGLARSLAAQGVCDEAMPLFGEARFQAGWDERAWVAEGQCAWSLGRPYDALEAFEWAERREPGAAVIQAALARVRLAIGDRAGSEAAVERLLSCDGGVEQEAVVRAELAMRGGGDADPWLFEAARTHPEAPVVAILDARRWMDLGDPAAAEATLRERPIPAAARDAVASWRAEALRRQGRTGDARELLAARVAAGRLDEATRAVWARVLVDLGEPEAAVVALGSAVGEGGAELLASRWYLARAARSADAERLAAVWRATNDARDRSLEQLVPIATPDARGLPIEGGP